MSENSASKSVIENFVLKSIIGNKCSLSVTTPFTKDGALGTTVISSTLIISCTSIISTPNSSVPIVNKTSNSSSCIIVLSAIALELSLEVEPVGKSTNGTSSGIIFIGSKIIVKLSSLKRVMPNKFCPSIPATVSGGASIVSFSSLATDDTDSTTHPKTLPATLITTTRVRSSSSIGSIFNRVLISIIGRIFPRKLDIPRTQSAACGTVVTFGTLTISCIIFIGNAKLSLLSENVTNCSILYSSELFIIVLF